MTHSPELTDNLLWTGESVFCVCGHHVEGHKTVHPLLDAFGQCATITYCGYKSNDGQDRCKCQEFKAYKISENENMATR